MKILTRILTFIFLAIVLTGCNLKKEVQISGRTMGTTYHIKVISGYFDDTKDLKQKIDQRLEEINLSMSTFNKDSEISRFNAFQEVDTPFKVSEDFYYVMRTATKIYRLTQGAWDGSIDPLVNRWGFGRDSRQQKPGRDEIEQLLLMVGFDKVVLTADGHALIKKRADLRIDLASIAKGYGVDEIVRLIRENGFQNCLVEIGGEVFASGTAKNGQPWRVGINTPQKDAAANQVYKVVLLKDQALATSGDYRNFFESGGVRYSHVIDPKTGYPVTNGVVSVSVQADSCILADGLATAIMVMGYEKGLALSDQLDNVESFVIVADKEGSISDYPSKNFNIVE